jgi:hypothetical protein
MRPGTAEGVGCQLMTTSGRRLTGAIDRNEARAV